MTLVPGCWRFRAVTAGGTCGARRTSTRTTSGCIACASRSPPRSALQVMDPMRPEARRVSSSRWSREPMMTTETGTIYL